jgi:hypothetical protein
MDFKKMLLTFLNNTVPLPFFFGKRIFLVDVCLLFHHDQIAFSHSAEILHWGTTSLGTHIFHI